MTRRPPLTCGHKACNLRRRAKQTFCESCWALVPRWLQRKIALARLAGDAAELTGHLTNASDHITRQRQTAAQQRAPEAIR